MTAVLVQSYPFLGYTCAHRVVEGHVVLDNQEWHEVADVLDERLYVGVPIISLAVGGAFLHLRPSARVVVAAQEPPQTCDKHRTPQALSLCEALIAPAFTEQGGER
ncbi:hypothetical protein AB0I84_38515 [Streptomyces spectabilis]|uniref:hypothetical protein n=1 Tax=Streptomyces spectabilis TaxID=68270 RepID=UPI0033D48E3F